MPKAIIYAHSALFDLGQLLLRSEQEAGKANSPPPLPFFFFKEFGTNIFTSSKAMTPDSTSQGVEKENMRLRGKAASVAARCREKEGETV